MFDARQNLPEQVRVFGDHAGDAAPASATAPKQKRRARGAFVKQRAARGAFARTRQPIRAASAQSAQRPNRSIRRNGIPARRDCVQTIGRALRGTRQTCRLRSGENVHLRPASGRHPVGTKLASVHARRPRVFAQATPTLQFVRLGQAIFGPLVEKRGRPVDARKRVGQEGDRFFQQLVGLGATET